MVRKEDPKLITGQGRYTDDIAVPGMLWLAYRVAARSPTPTSPASTSQARAKELPGVVAVYTGEELACEWARGHAAPGRCQPHLPRREHRGPRVPDHWPVAKDRVRYMGEMVAVVVADSREHAMDATEAVDVDWERAAGGDRHRGRRSADGAPVIHEQFGTQPRWRPGSSQATATSTSVFSEAPVVGSPSATSLRGSSPTRIEPRAVVVQPVPSQGEFTLWTSATQIHFVRVFLTLILGIPEAKLRVIAPEVGGGFGSKLEVYAEEVVAVALARKLGQPVKWNE